MLRSTATLGAIDINNGSESGTESTRVNHKEVLVVLLEWNRRTKSSNRYKYKNKPELLRKSASDAASNNSHSSIILVGKYGMEDIG
ncbi:hypothetical protein CFP56_000651 [Quercus suber]|uniref:Uncharacterized protein n=1 Tax=Quercus suber TaxID=58331 RepID=A0AAW0LHY3_QUESU